LVVEMHIDGIAGLGVGNGDETSPPSPPTVDSTSEGMLPDLRTSRKAAGTPPEDIENMAEGFGSKLQSRVRQ
jgi:hypothetical protein